MMKKSLQIPLFVLTAAALSGLSMFVPAGTDAADGGTIGVVSKWGFPFAYRTTAPGWARARFDAGRFGLNSLAWGAVLMGLRMSPAFRRNRRTGGAGRAP
jgi:hypothetical protein